ncbi:Isoflavone reductase family protein [Pleurostoma richardsiae]|uniref:Isoflavone reductase family protein n=1 Tax=Pleurostoma richardsiae TaxID=41990 RepID=A0AA38RFD7_9PEZI|nr:Isoflavone reductase family protein [Pleurostoma richardsiae]
MAPARILIFGATGNIGQHISDAIIAAKPSFGHVSIFTSASTVAGKAVLIDRWRAAGVSVIVGNITQDDDVKAAYQDTDIVVSALGRGAIDLQVKLIELAEESKTVDWFFPSEYGTDIEHGPSSATEKPHQKKLAVRRYIQENVRRLKVTYLVTGPYFEMWVRPSPAAPEIGGFDVLRREARLIDDGDGKVGFCTMPDVGKFLVAALRHPEASFNKVLIVQSFVVTPRQVLAEYERQTGVQWKVSSIPLGSLREVEAKLWAEGRPVATGATLRRIWAEGGTLYQANDNEALGLQAGDLETLEIGVRRDIAEVAGSRS